MSGPMPSTAARRAPLLRAAALPALLALSTACGSYVAGMNPSPAARAGPPRPITTVFVVRHAETKPDGTADPPLSAAGRQRAEALRDRLIRRPVDAVFATPYRRTRETAAPLAEALGLEVRIYEPRHSETLAETILRDFSGGRVLVVGHGNTVPLVIEALTGEQPADLAHEEYDALFELHLEGDSTNVRRHTYGARSEPSPAR